MQPPVNPTGLLARTQPPVNAAKTAPVHQHSEVELLLFEHGPVTMLYGGRPLRVPAEQLVVFWGAMPHQTWVADPKSIAHVVYVPLPMLLQWQLPAWFVERLTNFDVLVEPRRADPAPDLSLIRNWIRLLRPRTLAAERIVLLEIEARLRRLALTPRAVPALPPHSAVGRLEPMVAIIAQRCLDTLTTADVAREAGLTRSYAARLFRRATGLTMLEYITRQRVSHAQRLLVTTDRGVLDIMGACGFKSPARFYVVFRRFTGVTPHRYRQRFQATVARPAKGGQRPGVTAPARSPARTGRPAVA